MEIDNNAAERALRTVALGRKNYLFAGSDAGRERAAALYTSKIPLDCHLGDYGWITGTTIAALPSEREWGLST